MVWNKLCIAKKKKGGETLENEAYHVTAAVSQMFGVSVLWK